MTNLFMGNKYFDQDLSGWDVSNVNYMSRMFYGAQSFNRNLSGWCVSNFDSEPDFFSKFSALAENYHPVWGTCSQ